MRLSIILALMLTFLSAEPREALLIGNSNYQHISNLDDPSANLNRLKKTLKDLDFNVKIKTNLNSEELEESIDNFAKRLAKSSDAIGFLYYTGHGCQVDYQGYLVPTNVDTKIKRKIKYNALNINEMLETLEDAGNRVNMVFLDACRDIPTGAKGGTKGLGQPINTPNGSLVVYATKAGEVAKDNSYFIDALIKNLKTSNQTVRDLGDNISLSVSQKSSQQQIPVVYSSLLPKLLLSSNKMNVVNTLKVDKVEEKINTNFSNKQVNCDVYGNDASMCTSCEDGGHVYLGKGKKISDYWTNLSEYDDVYFKDENKIIFKYDTLPNGTVWITSNNLLQYTDNFTWTKGKKSNRFYHRFKANTKNKKYLETRDGGGIILTEINDKTKRNKISYRLILTKNYHKFYTNKTLSEIKTISSCLFYKPAWCGDGVRDEKYEECDFKDKSKKGFGSRGCTPTCKSM